MLNIYKNIVLPKLIQLGFTLNHEYNCYELTYNNFYYTIYYSSLSGMYYYHKYRIAVNKVKICIDEYSLSFSDNLIGVLYLELKNKIRKNKIESILNGR